MVLRGRGRAGRNGELDEGGKGGEGGGGAGREGCWIRHDESMGMVLRENGKEGGIG